MGEQAGAGDHFEAGVGEVGHHVPRPLHREELVVLTPDEQHRRCDLPVELAELAHEPVVEAAQQLHRCRPVLLRAVQRPQEEIVELAVEQRPVDERIAEHEAVATQARLAGEEPERRAEARHLAPGEERLELPTDAGGLLGVDERQGAQPFVAGHGVAGDHAAAVVTDDRHVREAEQVDDAAHAVDVVGERQLRARRVAAAPRTGKIDEVAGDVVGEVGEEAAEGRAADGPAVHEQHVRPGADRAVRHLAGADVEESRRRLAEQVGGLGHSEAHRTSAAWIFAAVARSK